MATWKDSIEGWPTGLTTGDTTSEGIDNRETIRRPFGKSQANEDTQLV